MKGLPGWILAVMVALTVALVWVGWDERHHAGWAPFILGVLFGVFTLASMGAKLADDGADEH